MVRETEKIENLEKLKLFCKEWLRHGLEIIPNY